MRYCHRGGLIRGLQNLETPCKGAKARAACGPDRGKLPAYQEVPERETGLFFLLLQKEPKSSRDFVLRPRFKTLQNNIFRELPALVPKPVYGATHFFGCFEPVRKGSCSADARLIFFENGLLYCKLTGASRIRKGWLLVIFVAVEICFCSMLIESFEINQSFSICPKLRCADRIFLIDRSFAFSKNFILSKKTPHFHKPIASLSMSVITYCHQKNSLRVCTKPHIRLY